MILGIIEDEGLQPGSRLPTSAELATRSGFSLISVRRALDARGFGHVPIAVGGLIPQSAAQALADAGVARAFHPGDSGIGSDIITGAMEELIGQSRIPTTSGD